MNRRAAILTGAASAIALANPALATKLVLAKRRETLGDYTLDVNDLSPRFLDFYAAAQGLSADARFAVWKDRYDFAAAPPGPRGEVIARKLLDAAWPKYAAALPIIRAGERGMRPRPLDVLVEVGGLFEATTPLTVGFIAYVGGFEVNAFTSGDADGVYVAAPIEMDAAHRTLTLPHEMTHAVHMLTGGLSRGYERSLGRVVFEEGLAMRAAQHVVPGLPDSGYVGAADWFAGGLANRKAILRGLLPALSRSDADTVFKFTFGGGTTGREREAYIAGWLVVGALLKGGKTFPALARIPESELPGVVSREITTLLADGADG